MTPHLDMNYRHSQGAMTAKLNLTHLQRFQYTILHVHQSLIQQSFPFSTFQYLSSRPSLHYPYTMIPVGPSISSFHRYSPTNISSYSYPCTQSVFRTCGMAISQVLKNSKHRAPVPDHQIASHPTTQHKSRDRFPILP